MSISEKANDLLNKFCGAQFDYVVWGTQDNLVARDKARQEISDRIAELEGLVDKLIEAGDWGAKLAINIGALSGDNQYKLAKKRYDKWDALVKDWKERVE